MRSTRLGLAFLTVTMLPFAATAEQTMIRIEARRGAAATEAASAWRNQFPDVVTFPLSGGWTGIALGPMERETATTMLEELKAQGRIPRDSFIVPAEEGGALTRVEATAGAADLPAGSAAAPADSVLAPEPDPQDDPAATADGIPQSADRNSVGDETTAVEPADVNAARRQMPPSGAYIRLQSLRDRDQADAALAEWRERFPEAGLAELPSGWFAVTLGPVEPAAAGDWLRAFQAAELAPDDAFVSTADELGPVVEPGTEPDLPAAGSAPMPPLDEVQRALRWAGHYDGAIDGKDGPQTRAAIAREIAATRAAPDAGTAMTRLIERRADWRGRMGLTELKDDHTGLSVTAPMDRLQHERTQRWLSIYGPRDESGAALILFSQPGGQQEMLDLAGLVTALGWVPSPERQVDTGRITLDGRNATHIGHAEARVADGRAEGFVLIWPVEDAEDQPRIAAEIADSLTRFAPGATDDMVADVTPAGGMDASGEADQAEATDSPMTAAGAADATLAGPDQPPAPDLSQDADPVAGGTIRGADGGDPPAAVAAD
ncbi:peptidoglycan-binding protein [uncultured Paracoccus sp.]|uniref:peptidoglycan-binding protein n=1 Tax=uncultured Paracoccus sp. TaxID=189685 RepID=UPI002616E9DE|nr:peptidoglycan-binding protein [uncultured Paracoccus sp.]